MAVSINEGKKINLFREMVLKFQIITFTPKFKNNIIIIHTYSGNTLAHNQSVHFNDAISDIRKEFDKFEIILEEMTASKFRDKMLSDNWKWKNVVDWLLASHIHFIICHPHQGLLEVGIDIEPIFLYTELKRLTYHIGFPNGEQLSCPIFTQDKGFYLDILTKKSLCNPTFFIEIKQDESCYRESLDK